MDSQDGQEGGEGGAAELVVWDGVKCWVKLGRVRSGNKPFCLQLDRLGIL